MKLHLSIDDFENLISITSKYIGIPESAVRRDYLIVMILEKLAASTFCDCCVFKGGTSLSKCYPNSINRFSEDIDLTYMTKENESDKDVNRRLKKIETVITDGLYREPIDAERGNRDKSSYVCFDRENESQVRVKLEIGSNVRPEPFGRRGIQTYIQDYLETQGDFGKKIILGYQLRQFEINVLDIRRTFIDKIFAVKRHTICGRIGKKVRHIYDVKVLMEMPIIEHFMTDLDEFKRIVRLTKNTDKFYLGRRSNNPEYDPQCDFDFSSWKTMFWNDVIRKRYETLHQDLLYSDKKQNFDEAIHAFERIDDIFRKINE